MNFKIGDRVTAKGNIPGFEGPGTITQVDAGSHVSEYMVRFDGKAPPVWAYNKTVKPLVESKIVITTDGVTTLARLYDGKKVVKRAEAKCSPSDAFSFNVGAQLAYNRLMYGTDYNHAEVALKPKTEAEDKPKEPVKLYCVKDYEPGIFLTRGKIYDVSDGKIIYDDGWSTVWTGSNHLVGEDGTQPVSGHHSFPLVSRPAKVGEWVLVTSENLDGASKGEICKVVAINDAQGSDFKPYLRTKERTIYGYPRIEPCTLARHNEYLVLDGYKPEPEQPQYWSGKAVCVKKEYGRSISLPDFTPGKVYAVVDGRITDDAGWKSTRYESLTDLCVGMGNTFIEYKGGGDA